MMGTYRVTDPQSGRTLKLTGDSPPTEQELTEIFGAQQATPPPSPQDQPLVPAQGGATRDIPQPTPEPVGGVSGWAQNLWDNFQQDVKAIPQAVEGVSPITTAANVVKSVRDLTPYLRFTNPETRDTMTKLAREHPGQAALDIFLMEGLALMPVGKIGAGIIKAGSARAIEQTFKYVPKASLEHVASVVGKSKYAPGWIKQSVNKMQQNVVAGRPSATAPMVEGTPISSTLVMTPEGNVVVGQVKALPPAPPGITESGVRRQFVGEGSTNVPNAPWRGGPEVRESITGQEGTIIRPPLSAQQVKQVTKSVKALRAAQKANATVMDLPKPAPERTITKQRAGGPPVFEDEYLAIRQIGETTVQPSWYTKLGPLSIETMPRMLERIHPNAKKLFYDPIRTAEGNWRKEHRLILDNFTQLRKAEGVGKKELNRIGLYKLAQDPDGLETLTKMGLAGKVPGAAGVKPLTVGEQKADAFMQNVFNDTWSRLNEVRSLAGKPPLPKIDNYMPFFRFVPKASVDDGFSLLDAVDNDFISTYYKSSKHMMNRVKGARQVFETTNAEDMMSRYLDSALNTIHTAPPITKGRELLSQFAKGATGEEKAWSLRKANPEAYKMLKYFLDVAAGQDVGLSLGKHLDGVLHKLGSNLTYSVLSANLRTALIQPFSLMQTAVEIGPRWTLQGLYHLLADIARPAGSRASKMAFDKSNVLIAREFDAALADLASQFGIVSKKMASSYNPAIRGAGQIIGKTRLQAGRIGFAGLKALDMLTAKATWMGAYDKAIKGLKLTEKDAINFADDVVIKTQASGLRMDRSAIQQHAVGKAGTLFQTFVINQWGWITKDVMGVGNAGMSKSTRFKKIASLLVAATGINYLTEDVMGIQSPIPNPGGAFLRTFDQTGSWVEASKASARELLEIVPVVGGATRWSSGFGGPIVDTANELRQSLAGAPGAPSLGEATLNTGARFAGIPGTTQAQRTIRAVTNGQGLRAALIGGQTSTPTSLKELKTLNSLQNMKGIK